MIDKIEHWIHNKSIELTVGGTSGVITGIAINWDSVTSKVAEAFIVVIITSIVGTVISITVGHFLKKYLRKNFPNEFNNERTENN